MTLLHLVGHDGTAHGDDALALARTLGSGRDVRRIVVHVLETPGGTSNVDNPRLVAISVGAPERIAAGLNGDERLEVAASSSAARGLHDLAEHLRADLLVVGAHHEDDGHFHLPGGSVVGQLLSGGPSAVAVAPDGYAAAARTLARIVVGFDGSIEAYDALAEAGGLAAASGAIVDVVYAEEGRQPGYASLMAATADERRRDDFASHRLAEEGLEAVQPAVRGKAAVRSGSPGAAVTAFAEDQGCDLVVLGSRGYGPLRRALLGSTGGHVLHHAGRPVLILPRGSHATVPETAHGYAIAP